MKKQLATMLSVLCLFALPALTQDFRSTISGHVTDSSGAAVPNAKVNAVNMDTQRNHDGDIGQRRSVRDPVPAPRQL